MRVDRRVFPARTLVALGLAVALATLPGTAMADLEPEPSAPGYPTWSDVDAARGDVAATAAEVNTVQAALVTAQAQSAAASQRAVEAQAVSARAEAALQAATTRAQTLSAQADAAAQAAAKDTAAAGRLALTLSRTQGEGALTVRLLLSHDPDQLLSRLAVLGDVTAWWKDATGQAREAQQLAASLRDSARQAEQARAAAAQAAAAASTAAQQAASTADAVAADLQQHTTTLVAQLATLKNTTADLEQRYQLGVQVAAQAAAQAAAAQAAAQASANSSSGSSGGGWSAPADGGGGWSPDAAQQYAQGAIGAYGWGGDQFSCLVSLWNMESGWQWNALNTDSGAYGIPQALPASKLAAAGADWRTDAATQIQWGLAYISNRYGSPCGAWDHEMSEDPHWY